MACTRSSARSGSFNDGFGDNRGAWNNPRFQRLVVRALYWEHAGVRRRPSALANDFRDDDRPGHVAGTRY